MLVICRRHVLLVGRSIEESIWRPEVCLVSMHTDSVLPKFVLFLEPQYVTLFRNKVVTDVISYDGWE